MTINLEKELMKANKKLATPSELLVLKEYEQHGELLKDDSLERVGLTQNLKKGNEIKTKAEKLKAETLKFDQSRVFHISQIEETCMKYYLRFLPSIHYEGTLDKELPFKINAFEAAYQVKCQCEVPRERGYWPIMPLPTFNEKTGRLEFPKGECIVQNTFIMAPKSSFELQEVPKDPLFFYKINEEYYYLIHKWGNDLNVGRRLMGFFSDNDSTTVLVLLMLTCSFIFNLLMAIYIGGQGYTFFASMSGMMVAVVSILSGLDQVRLISRNNWNSPYND